MDGDVATASGLSALRNTYLAALSVGQVKRGCGLAHRLPAYAGNGSCDLVKSHSQTLRWLDYEPRG